MRRAFFIMGIFTAVIVLPSCSKKPTPAETTTTTATSTATPNAATLDPPAPATPPPAPAPVLKKYKNVLHTGDSMVGGGLARALGPKFEADGTKYHRDVIESGTIHEFSQNDHLPGLLKSIKPDLVLVSLGANHIPNSVDPDKELGPFVPKLIKRLAGIDCYWIAPPIWKPHQAKFNAWLKERVAPCHFYEADVEIERRPDKIHPNEKGGEVWADDFWKFMKGDGAFVVDAPSPSLLAPH